MFTRPLRLYKHKNNTDVAFEILKKFYIKEGDRYSLKIRWWNISRDGKHDPFCMNLVERIKMPADWLHKECERIEL